MASPALDLTVAKHRGGIAPRAPIVIHAVSELGDDAAKLAAAAQAAPGPQPLQALRHSHHRLAQALAAGARVFEAAALTGYAPGTVSRLVGDPTFCELIKHYATERAVAAADVASRMSMLSLDAIEVLQERVTADPDSISTEVLTKLATAMLDRTGHAPVTKAVVAHQRLDPQELAALRGAASGVTLLSAREALPEEPGPPALAELLACPADSSTAATP